jgi:hypothetical protein
MNLLELPRIYLEALAMHEALRRLGVEPDHVFFTVSGGQVVALVREDAESEIKFSVALGQAPEDFERVWPEACRAWNSAPEAQMNKVWQQSAARHNTAALVVMLDLTGVKTKQGSRRWN